MEEGTALAGCSGGLSRLGPLLSHIGMLLLIVGGLAASITGYQARVSGATGDTISRPEWDFDLRIDDFKLVYYPISLNQWVELPDGHRGRVTEIRHDSARVDLSSHPGLHESRWLLRDSLRNDFEVYRNGRLTPYQGNIRSYITRAELIKDGQPVLKRKIEVNHPLRYGGFRFYQTSFETGGGNIDVDTVVVLAVSEDNDSAVVRLAVRGEAEKLPWGDLNLKAGEFFPDFKLDRNMQPFSASGELINPAVRVTLVGGGREIGAKWVFSHDFGGMGGSNMPLKLRIVDLTGVNSSRSGYATILEVKRDSGRWIIWMGFFCVTLGLVLTYSMTQRQAWAVVLRKPEGKDEIHLAYRNSRIDHRTRDYFERLN
ncbi:MAG TPA: hypothetical protein ENL08_02560 [Bacteroidetes bacterium]|nr:hypothetical protein [Bacteroidota bacterium]